MELRMKLPFAKPEPMPACCKNGHAFTKHHGVFITVIVCSRCGKKVRGVGA